MFRRIFQLCCGVRKHYGSSPAWAESATDQDLDAPTDFDGVMPPYKDAEDRKEPPPYYMNGVGKEGEQKTTTCHDSMSVQSTIAPVTDALVNAYPEDLQFVGAGDAKLSESNKVVATFAWTIDVNLDELELVGSVPGSGRPFIFERCIFACDGQQYLVNVPWWYAERRKAREMQMQIGGSTTNGSFMNGLICTPPRTPTDCEHFDAASWA